MKQTITLGDVQSIGNTIFPNWDSLIGETKLNSVALYSIIALKKKIQSHYVDIQDTVMQVALKHGGEVTTQGMLRVPPESVEAVNKELEPIYSQKVEIECVPIKLGPSDEVPARLMEAFFDFVEIKE